MVLYYELKEGTEQTIEAETVSMGQPLYLKNWQNVFMPLECRGERPGVSLRLVGEMPITESEFQSSLDY